MQLRRPHSLSFTSLVCRCLCRSFPSACNAATTLTVETTCCEPRMDCYALSGRSEIIRITAVEGPDTTRKPAQPPCAPLPVSLPVASMVCSSIVSTYFCPFCITITIALFSLFSGSDHATGSRHGGRRLVCGGWSWKHAFGHLGLGQIAQAANGRVECSQQSRLESRAVRCRCCVDPVDLARFRLSRLCRPLCSIRSRLSCEFHCPVVGRMGGLE